MAPAGTLGAVQLQHQLVSPGQQPGQPGTVPAGALDRPGPQHRMLAGEVHQGLVPVRGGLHRQLAQHPAGAGIDHRGTMGLHVGVHPDDDLDDLRQTSHAFISICPEGRNGSGPGGDGKTVTGHTGAASPAVKLLIRPHPPAGPGPATTGGQVPAKTRSQSVEGSHPRSPAHSPAAITRLRGGFSQSVEDEPGRADLADHLSISQERDATCPPPTACRYRRRC